MATRTQLQFERPYSRHLESDCEVLYDKEHRRIQALCQWMMPNTAQARDLAIDVFMEAWRDPGPGGTATLPLRLTRSLVTHFWPVFHPLKESQASMPSVVKDDGSRLRRAVTALPLPHRLLYLMHETEGISPEVLAQWLDLETRSCAHMIHQARLELRRKLAVS